MDDIACLIPSDINPHNVLIICQTPPKNAPSKHYHYCPPGAKLPKQYFELTLLIDALEHLSLEQGQRLIGILKNQHSRRLLIYFSNQEKPTDWTFNKLIGLGFKQEEATTNMQLYSYNISHYNPKRAWNNTQFWANPEQWNKRF